MFSDPTSTIEHSAVFERAHQAAVARGGSETGMRESEERELSSCALLSLAVCQVVDLAVIANVVDASDRLGQRPSESTSTALARRCAATIRLVTRALEIHGRDVGYDHTPWLGRAIERAAAGELAAVCVVDRVRVATTSIAHALAATENDRMAIPEHIAAALGGLLRTYTLANRPAWRV